MFNVFKAESETKHKEKIFLGVFLQNFLGGENKIVLKLKFQRKGDMSDLGRVIFLKFVRFGANFAQTIVLGYSLMNKSGKIRKLKIRPLKGQFSGLT